MPGVFSLGLVKLTSRDDIGYMAKKSFQAHRDEFSVDELIQTNYQFFESLPDPRNRVIGQSIADICQAGFAMFHLKFSSLLEFDSQTVYQRENLKSVYGLREVCSDTQMRRMIDQIDPTPFLERIAQIVRQDFYRVGGRRQFQVLDGRLVLSLDGVEHFRSTRVHCQACLTKDSKSQGRVYFHQMLCGSIVKPGESTVFVAVAEPIVKQDGATKNDCEQNAARRVIDRLPAYYPGEKFLVVADSLYSRGPFIEQLTGHGYDFLLAAKPGDHKSLFQHFDTWAGQGATTKMTKKEGPLTHRFEWAKGLNLNEAWASTRLNVLKYEQEDAKGKITRFSWVTNRKIARDNVYQLMRVARSRWKIENETFNTLKNQGYHFEHNYGHGEKHLATGLAYLMLMAFLIDQLNELCSKKFKLILKKARTRVKVWFSQKALFTTWNCESFNSIYGRLAELYGVQLI